MMCCVTRRPKGKESKFTFENGTYVYASTAREALDKLLSTPRITSCTHLRDKVWVVSFDRERHIEVEDCKDAQNARQKAAWRLYLDKRDPIHRSQFQP